MGNSIKEFIKDSRLTIVSVLVIGILLAFGFYEEGSSNRVYFFIILYIIFALLLSLAGLAVNQYVYKIWLNRRSQDMKNLANEFNLSFSSQAYNLKSLIRRTPVIVIQGQVNNHKVIISDILNFNIFRGVLPWMRHTRLEVDGQVINDKIKNFTFGIPQILTPVHELRSFLKTLR